MKIRYQIALLYALLFCTLTYAQDSYKPTDKWPYVFEKFSPSVIHQTAGKGLINVEANVCIADGSLHYLEDGIILQATATTIEKVEIGSKQFISLNNVLMEILVETPEGMIVKTYNINLNAPGVDIGFGMTSTNVAAGTVDLTATSALGSSLLHTKIAEAALESEYGTALNVETMINFLVNGYLIPATKKDFTEAVGKDAANAFLKSNKIKWNDPASMIPAISFIKKNK